MLVVVNYSKRGTQGAPAPEQFIFKIFKIIYLIAGSFPVLVFFSQQSKDKICDKDIDTTEAPLYSTTTLQPTTTKFRVLTTTRGFTSSQLPTSLPTEGELCRLI